MAGKDVSDGYPRAYTAVFSGDRKDYIVTKQDGRVTVEGLNSMRYGYDILIKVEKLRFGDKEVNTDVL